MFKQRTPEEYEAIAEAGTRPLFTLGDYRFHDTLDGEGTLHHMVEDAADAEGYGFYELDAPTMYEFMARYLAGLYEMEAYSLDHSPAHLSLLDVLEITTTRARAGEDAFSWDEFDPAETEVLGEMEDDVDKDVDEE